MQVKHSMLEQLEAVCSRHGRVAVTGAPTSGKTFLTSQLNCSQTVIHADDATKGLGWSQSSEYLAKLINTVDGPIVVEGVQIGRALRKGMKVDCLVILPQPMMLEKRHQGMAKGIETVLLDCQVKRMLEGVEVVFLVSDVDDEPTSYGLE